jgi:hypothetical protein
MVEMAKHQAISEDRLRRWEKDREPAPMPALKRDFITHGQVCRVFRQRLGWGLQHAADRMGISRMTMWKAEHDRTSGVHAVRHFYHQRALPRPRAATPVRVSPEGRAIP